MTQEELNEQLINAARTGNKSIVAEMLALGADVNTVLTEDNYVYTDESEDIKVFLGATSLMFSCAYGYPEIIQILLDHDADINIQDRSGWTALMYATWNESYPEIGIYIKKLLKAGADPNIQDKFNNWTALMNLAIWSGDTDLMETLVEAGADINAKNNDGQTALDILKNEYPEKHSQWISSMVRQVKRETLRQEDTAHAGRCEPDFDI